jgi:hypothetical protein
LSFETDILLITKDKRIDLFKLMVFGVALAVVFGVLSYEDEKLVIDTIKGKKIIDKSCTLLKKNIDKSTAFIQDNVEVK